MTEPGAVVFLDVDGVLHSVVAGDLIEDAAGLDKALTESGALEAAVEGGTVFVLPSTWRHGFECGVESTAADGSPRAARPGPMRPSASAGSARWLKCARLAAVPGPRLVSKTPRHPEAGRPAEALAWVERPRPAAWVAVGDEPGNLRLPGAHRVLTDGRRGITPDQARQVAALLAAQRPA